AARRRLARARPRAPRGVRRGEWAASRGRWPDGLGGRGAGRDLPRPGRSGHRRGCHAHPGPLRPEPRLGRRRRRRPPVPPAPRRRVSSSKASRRVLVVEDDSAIREALVEVLGDAGYEAVTAADGRTGLRLAAEQIEPCAILLDWRMPVLDGPE